MNTCNKCKSVKYCNAACKKKHRTKHKKDCERRVAELHDEQLFKKPLPNHEDCPICFLRLPYLGSGSVYMACCGKTICRGCIYAVQEKDTAAGLCPFCRTPPPFTEEETIARYEKRINVDNDAKAMHSMGSFYDRGYVQTNHTHTKALKPQNRDKALKLYLRAGELGYVKAYYRIACAYAMGRGVNVDMKKSTHYLELCAMEGSILPRLNLGIFEAQVGNMDRALRHWMIAAEGGGHNCLKKIQEFCVCGYATKEEYAEALRAYQAYVDEVKSNQRDEAAAAHDEYQYLGDHSGSVVDRI